MKYTTTSPTPIRSEEPKRQTAKEVIAANIQNLMEQLEAGHSEALTAYLTAMSRFTTTASATFWRSHGRNQTQRA